MKNIETELSDYSEIYDAVQTGEIEASMGDTVNGKFLMVNGYHLEPLSEGPFFKFTETIKNHSTGLTFTDSYISNKHCPIDANLKHLEVLNVEKIEIVIPA